MKRAIALKFNDFFENARPDAVNRRRRLETKLQVIAL
jgi:hypothetical protein